MNAIRFFLPFLIMTLPVNAWAYGSSSSTKSCAKPKFSEFVPADKAEVAAQSEFSFIASANAYPESIKVTVKKLPVTVNVTDKNGAYLVTGKLPDALSDTYARISISAEGPNRCKGNGGWLVKISE
ncbi:MAG: hypothetical protein ACU85E_08125 [Gammaproteobacteria bacterium]